MLSVIWLGELMVRYSQKDVADRAGVHVQTIMKWTRQGIIPPSYGSTGKGAYYGQEHIDAAVAHARRNESPGRYTIRTICEKFQISVSTFHDMRRKGVFPPPIGWARGAYYTEEHIQLIAEYRDWVDTHYRLKPTKPDVVRRKVTGELRAQVWDKCKGRCHYCGRKLHPFRTFQADHIIPITQGGTNDLKNLVGSCSLCNQRKSNKQYDQAVAVIIGDTLIRTQN